LTLAVGKPRIPFCGGDEMIRPPSRFTHETNDN
jgi:hypothetical protein